MIIIWNNRMYNSCVTVMYIAITWQVTKYKGKRQGKPSSQTNKRGKVRGFALHMWIEPYNRVVHTRAMSCIHCSVHYILCIFGVFRICAASSRYPSHSAYRTGLN